MGKHRQKRLYVLGGLGLLLLLSACKKEVIPPDIKEEPKFYIAAMLNGDSFRLDAGLNDYQIVPKAWTYPFGTSARMPFFSTVFTDGKDSLIIALAGKELGSPRDVADEFFLNATLDIKSFTYKSLFNFPSAYVSLKKDGIWYDSYELQIPGAHFDVLNVENYSPAGAQHSMRKVEVIFKCLLRTEHEPYEYLVFEDAKAILPFTYEVK